MEIVVALAVVVAIAAAVLLSRRRPRDPLARRMLALAERRGLQRLSPEHARQELAVFDNYLADERPVSIAIGGEAPAGGRLVVAEIGSREPTAVARPFVFASVIDPALPQVSVDLDARSVRTVRVVAGGTEVDVDDPRLARGYRVTSHDPEAAREVLDREPSRTAFVDALHRPIPWVIDLRLRPGAVAVHLSRAEEVPSDVDELERLVGLIEDVAAALRRTP